MLNKNKRLKFQAVSTLILATTALPLSTAWAKKAPQTFSAIEEETESKPEPVLTQKLAQKSAPTSPLKASATAPTHSEVLIEKGKFDHVPSDQVDSIARRLKLVEVLLRKYGRAYDYRIHTLSELETILANLEPSPNETGSAETELPLPPNAQADVL
jgi:uncharacterized protein YkwD